MSSTFLATRSHRALALAFIAAMVLAAAPVSAAADVPTPTSLTMTLLLEPHGTQEPLLLVAGELPPDQSLPAEIALPVPEGARVEWAGDILGGPVSEDIPAEATIETRDGVNVAVFTLTQSRVGQVEVTYPGATTPVEGEVLSAGFEAGVPYEVESVRMAVAVPPSLQAASLPEGALTSQGPEGFIYYYTERGPLAPGDTAAFSLEYRPAPLPASGGVPGAAERGEVPPLLIVLIAVVIAGAVLFLFVSRTRAQVDVRERAAFDAGKDEGHADEDEGPTEDSHQDTLGESRLDRTVDTVSGAPVPESTAGSGLAGWLTPKRLIVIVAVLVLTVVVLVNIGGESGQVGVTEVSGGWVSQRISDASAESESEFSLQILCDCPPEVEATKMFDVLRQVPGVAHASLETNTLNMRILYDSALVDEASIAQRLRAAGYLQ